MEIKICGKLERNNNFLYTKNEIDQLQQTGDEFVFVQYLIEEIYLGDVFVLEDGTEITLREIKLQFDTKEPLTMIGHGWKCLCKFDNFDLNNLPAVRDWFDGSTTIVAKRKASVK